MEHKRLLGLFVCSHSQDEGSASLSSLVLGGTKKGGTYEGYIRTTHVCLMRYKHVRRIYPPRARVLVLEVQPVVLVNLLGVCGKGNVARHDTRLPLRVSVPEEKVSVTPLTAEDRIGPEHRRESVRDHAATIADAWCLTCKIGTSGWEGTHGDVLLARS